ncbi:MAG TPA: hypothetical protein VLI39_08800 [Sedimentisphaerales bacterium]|nr:hypothetical protein [Sedimentisphaerales bacterium]
MHRRNQDAANDRKTKETEVEAVAYVVCQGVGLDMNTASCDGIQLYNGDRKEDLKEPPTNRTMGDTNDIQLFAARVDSPRQERSWEKIEREVNDWMTRHPRDSPSLVTWLVPRLAKPEEPMAVRIVESILRSALAVDPRTDHELRWAGVRSDHGPSDR